MTASSPRPVVRVSGPGGLLATVPHLFGFTPRNSLVVLAVDPGTRQLQTGLRYDLPATPDTALAREVVGHTAQILGSHGLTAVVVAGYGPGHLVTPFADAARQLLPPAGITVLDIIRAEDSHWWSYLCEDPSCCPPAGQPLRPADEHTAALLTGDGTAPLASREELAATLAPVTGGSAQAMTEATRQAETTAATIVRRDGRLALQGQGLAAVQAAIRTYRHGGAITSPYRHAWLALVLRSLRVRDDAWARMDPSHRQAHARLWDDLTCRAQPGYAAAPACLLALTAWQDGRGALANIALDRALADTPGYSMAQLLRDALNAGTPPSVAIPPMTPDQVAASYASPPTNS